MVKRCGLTPFLSLLRLTCLWRDRCWELLLTVLQFHFFCYNKTLCPKGRKSMCLSLQVRAHHSREMTCRSLTQLILHRTHSHEQGEANICSLVLSSLTQSRDSLVHGPGHSSWVFLHQLAIKTIFHKYVQRPISSRKFLSGNLLSDEFRLLQINS